MVDGRLDHESHIRRSRSMRRVLDITLIQGAVITAIGTCTYLLCISNYQVQSQSDYLCLHVRASKAIH
jgi:hypothetical protein